MISMAAGTMPAPTMSVTAWPACSMLSKYPTMVLWASASGVTRRVILVAMPSVPSEPTKAPTRS